MMRTLLQDEIGMATLKAELKLLRVFFVISKRILLPALSENSNLSYFTLHFGSSGTQPLTAACLSGIGVTLAAGIHAELGTSLLLYPLKELCSSAVSFPGSNRPWE